MLWLCIIQMVCLVRAKQGWGTGTFLHYAIVRLLLKSGVKRNFVWHTRRQSTGRGQGVKTMWLYFWFLVLPISVFKLVSILLLFVSSIFSIQHAYYLLWFNQVHFARLKICLLFSYIGVVKSLSWYHSWCFRGDHGGVHVFNLTFFGRKGCWMVIVGNEVARNTGKAVKKKV